MRNIAVHEYFGVDNMIVWETLQKNLPPLLSSKPSQGCISTLKLPAPGGFSHSPGKDSQWKC